MSRLIRCEKGHFYDADKWKSCPNCDKSPQLKRENDMDDMQTMRLGQHVTQASARRVNFEHIPVVTETETVAEDKNYPKRAKDGTVVWKEEDDEKTISIFQPKSTIDPVCGWIVCVSGLLYGKDFRIIAGKNTIGRNTNMDIIIAEDHAVSRDTHVSIIYDNKNNDTWLVPGQGTLTYQSGNLVKTAMKLKSGDTFEIGNSRFMYIAFCEGERTWDKEL